MDADSIIISIRKILRSVNLESKRIQKEHGISIPQLLLLTFLSKQPGFKATHKEVSQYLNLNSSTITGITSRLEKKGVIARVTKPEDRRVSFITLTALGQQLLKSTPKLMHERLAQKLQSTDPKKVKELEKAFSLVIEFMGIQDIEAAPVITVDEFNS
ncbi:MarR family winged helix-turn-helix transcriptional regulator [Fulvivirga lutea]|uniref:MarR family transcriptional regulator n=1 Tax=Fulvivirga lutea TaxID=2810512 RepID=A0A974WE65_9BACT|nr:MarR family transcriptional regulator [Fulvivirga lutea]QSE96361.1 MarR family transcriptional regulator [Fulvivirga lutea]